MVTGIGDDPHLDPLELSPGGDPYVMELADMVGKLAEALRRKGEAGLQTLPGMTSFEGTLRAYCVGYLQGPPYEGRAGLTLPGPGGVSSTPPSLDEARRPVVGGRSPLPLRSSVRTVPVAQVDRATAS